MNDVIDKGYAEKVPPEEISTESGETWYIPHHRIHVSSKETW